MEATDKKQKNGVLENYVNWFEIPVLNLNRAVAFYNQIYGIDMEMTETNGYSMAFFPAEMGIGGALVMGPGCVPSQTGSLLYLNAGKDLQNVLGKVESNGGRVILEKTEIDDDAGHFALFIDSEGNKLALHSKKETNTKPRNKRKTENSGSTAQKENSKEQSKKKKVEK